MPHWDKCFANERRKQKLFVQFISLGIRCVCWHRCIDIFLREMSGTQQFENLQLATRRCVHCAPSTSVRESTHRQSENFVNINSFAGMRFCPRRAITAASFVSNAFSVIFCFFFSLSLRVSKVKTTPGIRVSHFIVNYLGMCVCVCAVLCRVVCNAALYRCTNTKGITQIRLVFYGICDGEGRASNGFYVFYVYRRRWCLLRELNYGVRVCVCGDVACIVFGRQWNGTVWLPRKWNDNDGDGRWRRWRLSVCPRRKSQWDFCGVMPLPHASEMFFVHMKRRRHRCTQTVHTYTQWEQQMHAVAKTRHHAQRQPKKKLK